MRRWPGLWPQRRVHKDAAEDGVGEADEADSGGQAAVLVDVEVPVVRISHKPVMHNQELQMNG